MKKVLLSTLSLFLVFLSSAQRSYLENFDDGKVPGGWTVVSASVRPYENPNNNCATNSGGLAIQADLRNPVNEPYIITKPLSFDLSQPRITVSFDLFLFDNALTCAAQKRTFDGVAPDVDVYLVNENYNSRNEPTGADILAMGTKTLEANITNAIALNVTTPLPSGNYRLFIIARDKPGVNTQQTTIFLIDNLRILETVQAALPVSFKSFTATRANQTVSLKWETASEQNNKGFYVQRNTGGEWKDVGLVFSKSETGNSSSTLSYSFTDVNNSKGVTQYRLLQVDIDGKGRYSIIRPVPGQAAGSKLLVYPNPSSNGTVNIQFDEANSVRDVSVSDLAGRIVKQYNGVSGNILTIENLADGYYSIQIANRATATTTVEKVIIKKR